MEANKSLDQLMKEQNITRGGLKKAAAAASDSNNNNNNTNKPSSAGSASKSKKFGRRGADGIPQRRGVQERRQGDAARADGSREGRQEPLRRRFKRVGGGASSAQSLRRNDNENDDSSAASRRAVDAGRRRGAKSNQFLRGRSNQERAEEQRSGRRSSALADARGFRPSRSGSARRGGDSDFGFRRR